ncbi:MAG: DUF1638 domain-containing protein [Deltaproteobacteria bacterium]|nr:DUF1638 domain-containing protein [Deltaproteobacteria bacterium]
MSVGVICCKVLEKEIREVVRHVPEVTHIHVMEWGLHIRPDVLLETLCREIRQMENRVDAIMLGYGRCQALDRLPDDFAVPVFYPEGEDCIGVLLGQDRYDRELMQTAGTWFLTPGWTELGMEFIFEELQVQRMTEKGYDPLALAHRMLKDFSRALLIDMQLEGGDTLRRKALAIADEFGWELEKAEGSLIRLKQTLHRAIDAAPPLPPFKNQKILI